MSLDASYADRGEAGRILAAALRGNELGDDPVLLALPRGGVPVAAQMSRLLNLPLEVFLVRKLGAPRHPEFAMGAIASGGIELLDQTFIARAGISPAEVDTVVRREERELARRERLYRPNGPPVLGAHAVVVVDDGLATGFTMRAAVTALRRMGCPRIAVAVPVGATTTCAELEREVDLLVCPLRPDELVAVGRWYEDFTPTDDAEVRSCLARTRRLDAGAPTERGKSR